MPDLISSGAILGLWALIGYLIGSVPSGVIIARLMGLGNLREIGSGNIGATNVLRTGNKTAAALTLVLDAAKGAVAPDSTIQQVMEAAMQVDGPVAVVDAGTPQGQITYDRILARLLDPRGAS